MMNFDDVDFDTQHRYFLQYKVDAIELGALCDKHPGMQRAWEQFKTVYELCKDHNETDRTIS